MIQVLGKFKICCLLVVVGMLASCGGQDGGGSNLSGQVAGLRTATPVNHFAASRVLEQASMGPSPSSVAQLKAQGVEAWIASQTKLPATLIVTPANIVEYELNLDRAAERRFQEHFEVSLNNLFIGAEDQLRVRTSWVLSNYLVISTRKVQPFGALEFMNILQKNAFGQYGDLLKAVTRNAAMGFYLDNGQNTRWQLNENYGRELMQLFSVGLVQLNLNGTVKKDAAGKPLETYTQKDVIEATRALTGWGFAEPNVKRASSNGFNYAKPMEVNYADSHDTGAKTLLGKTIPAGQDALKDLDSLIEILVTHPNTAPFVSLRLIQGMTTSDPSPAYLERVATVFKDTKGNLGKVVTAILVDPEARLGDVVNRSAKGFGRIKEPFLMTTSMIRGLGCRGVVRDYRDTRSVWQNRGQNPLGAYSVFGFFPPNHRTQGTNVLAPEQKLLNSTEFSNRMWNAVEYMRSEETLTDAGCDVSAFKSAAAVSDAKLVELIGERYFRGAMPASLANSLIELTKYTWEREKPMVLTGAMLDAASMSPAFGVSK